jgi:hypothetical protein
MSRTWLLAAIVGAVLVIAAGVVFVPKMLGTTPTAKPAHLTIGTTPVGVEVTIDGQARGLTPLTVQLDPGTHSVTLRRGTDERLIPVQLASGADVTQHYEFAPQPTAAPVVSSTLSIITEPPGARVLIDGESKGTSPVVVPDLTVARHKVVVVGENGTLERQVTTEAGLTTSVVFSLPRAPAMSAGWLAVTAPFEIQVLERGDIIGTSVAPRFMIPSGAHELDLVNEPLGFKEHRRVEITAGATASVRIDARAAVSVNARPWADVLIDGKPAGQTPLSNLSLTLGPHQIVFRHPEMGERQQTVVVTANGPNRIAADLTK